MGNLGKLSALLFIAAFTASSLIMVESASASSIPKPSVPEFKIYLVNHPYEVAPVSPVYTTDPYTGEQKLVTHGSAGYHVDNVTIELWILNQQPSYSNGTTTFTPYYNVRTKGHYEQTWTELNRPFKAEYILNFNDTRTYIPHYIPAQSGSKYTILSYSSAAPAGYYSTDIATYPPNATVDFQVSAMIGHPSPIIVYESRIIFSFGRESQGIALDAQSDWSETQSITLTQPLANNSILASTLENPAKQVATAIPIPTDTPNPTATPTQTPTVTPTIKPTSPNTDPTSTTISVDMFSLLIIGIAIPIVAISVLFYARHRKLKRSTK